MKYEIENFGYFDQLIIEMRYLLLALIFLICVIGIEQLFHGLNVRLLLITVVVVTVVLVRLHLIVSKKVESKSYNYIDIDSETFNIAFGNKKEQIMQRNISKCIVYNIFGNKNFVVFHSGKTSSFLLNGLQESFVTEISKLLNGVKIETATVFETSKYIIKDVFSTPTGT